MTDNNAMEVDLSAGFKHVDTVDEIVISIRQTLKTITQEVEQAKMTWQGGANASFTAVATEWDGEAQRLNKALDELALTLGDSAFKGGEQVDDNIAGTFSGIQVGGLNL